MGNKIARMQKKASVFMKGPKNKMREWWGNMCTRWRKMCKRWDKTCTQWENIKFHYPKMACLLQYGGLFLLVVLVFHVLSGMANVVYFRYPFNETANLTINVNTDTEIYAAERYADNARSILCTLVGSEAAIIAIVISLTLIAIELTASEYSPRVIDISLKNPDMWILLLIYGISIFSSIILIKQLPYDAPMIKFEDVSFAFWLGVFSYVALVPYLLNIIRLLNPTNIVRQVSRKIAEDEILKDISKNHKNDKEGTSKGDETVENKIQPILDIIYRSINNYDLETVRKGLDEIGEHAKNVIDSYFFSWDDVPGKDNEKLLNFLMYYFDIDWAENAKVCKSKSNDGDIISISNAKDSAKIRINERGKEAILEFSDDKPFDLKVKTESEKQIIYINPEEKEQWISEYFCYQLKRIARLAASKDDAGSTIEVIKNLESFGEHTANAELNAATEQVAAYLEAVGNIAAERGKAFEDAVTQVAESLEKVGNVAAGKGLEEATKRVATALDAVGETAAADEGLEEAIKQIASSLGAVGETAAKKGLEEATKGIASSLCAVGKAAADDGLKAATDRAIASLEVVGTTAAENKLKAATVDVAFSLGAVGGAAAAKGKELEGAVKQTAESLKCIVTTAASKGEELEDVVKQTAESLKCIGTTAASKGEELEGAVKQLASALGAVGKMAAKKGKGVDKATEEVAKALEMIGVSAAGRKLQNAAIEVVKNLLAIGNNAKEEELEDTPVTVVIALEAVGKVVAECNLKYAALNAVTALNKLIDEKFGDVDVMSRIASALEAVGNATIMNSNLEESTKVAVYSLIKLKKVADKENLKDVQKEADKYINKLKRSNKEIVQNAIDKYK